MSEFHKLIYEINQEIAEEYNPTEKIEGDPRIVEAIKELPTNSIDDLFIYEAFPFYVFSPLKYAAFIRDVDLVSYVLSQGPTVNMYEVVEGQDTTTALNIALEESAHVRYNIIMKNKVSNPIAIMIIEAHNKSERAGLDHAARDGVTPLIACCYSNNIEVARCLLENGANPTIKSKDGMTPYEICIKRKHNKLAELIEQATVDGGLKRSPKIYENVYSFNNDTKKKSLYSVKEEYCILNTAKDLGISPLDVIKGISSKYKPDDSITLSSSTGKYKFKGNEMVRVDGKVKPVVDINMSQLFSAVGIFIPEGVERVKFSSLRFNPNILKLWGVKMPSSVERIEFDNQYISEKNVKLELKSWKGVQLRFKDCVVVRADENGESLFVRPQYINVVRTKFLFEDGTEEYLDYYDGGIPDSEFEQTSE